MISLLIYIKHSFPAIWFLAEKFNGLICRFRYPQLRDISEQVGNSYIHEGYSFSRMNCGDIDEILELINSQSDEYMSHFNPHNFDKKTFQSMINNGSYAVMKASDSDSGKIVGYFFLRLFFVGKAFHGLMTDEQFSNRGIGSSMWKISQEICRKLGIRMFATIHSGNKASLLSAKKACGLIKERELKNNYLLVEFCQE